MNGIWSDHADNFPFIFKPNGNPLASEMEEKSSITNNLSTTYSIHYTNGKNILTNFQALF